MGRCWGPCFGIGPQTCPKPTTDSLGIGIPPFPSAGRPTQSPRGRNLGNGHDCPAFRLLVQEESLFITSLVCNVFWFRIVVRLILGGPSLHPLSIGHWSKSKHIATKICYECEFLLLGSRAFLVGVSARWLDKAAELSRPAADRVGGLKGCTGA